MGFFRPSPARRRAKRLALGLTLAQALVLGANEAAQAQFFQPFGYSYRSDLLPDDPYDEERPRFATPRAVSRILARRGFELVSGLGRRGDQVVVTGVSRRDGTFRFFIDPYEGEVIHAVRLSPPVADAPPPFEGPGAEAPRDFGRPPPDRPVMRRQAQPAGDPVPAGGQPPLAPLAKASPKPAAPTAASSNSPAPKVPGSEATKPQEPAKPIEWAKPAEIANPPEAAKVEAPKPEASTAEKAKPEAAKTDPAKSADAKADGAKPAPVRPGVPGRRAIVAPKTPDAAPAAQR